MIFLLVSSPWDNPFRDVLIGSKIETLKKKSLIIDACYIDISRLKELHLKLTVCIIFKLTVRQSLKIAGRLRSVSRTDMNAKKSGRARALSPLINFPNGVEEKREKIKSRIAKIVSNKNCV